MDGFEIDSVVKEVGESVQKHVQLQYTPDVKTIDANPDYDEQHPDYKAACDCRAQILNYICTLPHVDVAVLQLPKLDALIQADHEEIHALQGEIIGYRKRYTAVEEKQVIAFEKTVEAVKRESADRIKLKEVTDDLNDKDSLKEMQVGDAWSVSRGWKIGWHEFNFVCRAPLPITRVLFSTPTNFKWDYHKTDYEVQGKLIGNWFSGINASVVLYTHNKKFYESQIPGLREIQKSAELVYAKSKLTLEHLQEAITSADEEMKKMTKFIQEKISKIEVLSKENLSVSEAWDRLNKMHNK